MENETRTNIRTVIITGPGFQDHDVVYSYYRCKEEGYNVDISTKDGELVVGKYGITVPMDKRSKDNISFDQLDTKNGSSAELVGEKQLRLA